MLLEARERDRERERQQGRRNHPDRAPAAVAARLPPPPYEQVEAIRMGGAYIGALPDLDEEYIEDVPNFDNDLSWMDDPGMSSCLVSLCYVMFMRPLVMKTSCALATGTHPT